MSETSEELLDVDEEKLKYRINYIKENLLQMSNKLREEIPEDLTDQDLTEAQTDVPWESKERYKTSCYGNRNR